MIKKGEMSKHNNMQGKDRKRRRVNDVKKQAKDRKSNMVRDK